MKRMDVLLIAVILLIAAVWLAVSQLRGGAGSSAVVYVDGEETARIPLASLPRQTLRLIETAEGQNMLLLEPDGVTMQWAACRTQDCVHTGKITRRGQVIACLPHRVMVVLEGAAREGDFDAVTG